MFNHYHQRVDDYIPEEAYKKGGWPLRDKEHTKRLRSFWKELSKMIGQKLVHGSFDLTKISYPVKCMSPKSFL